MSVDPSFAIPSFAIVSFPMASILPCAAEPVTDTLCPACLLRSTDVLDRVRVVAMVSLLMASLAMVSFPMVSFFIVSFFMASLAMWSSATCVRTKVPAVLPASIQPV